jgi:hypothetical protein
VRFGSPFTLWQFKEWKMNDRLAIREYLQDLQRRTGDRNGFANGHSLENIMALIGSASGASL